MSGFYCCLEIISVLVNTLIIIILALLILFTINKWCNNRKTLTLLLIQSNYDLCRTILYSIFMFVTKHEFIYLIQLNVAIRNALILTTTLPQHGQVIFFFLLLIFFYCFYTRLHILVRISLFFHSNLLSKSQCQNRAKE